MKKAKHYFWLGVQWMQVRLENWRSMLQWRTLLILGLAVSVSSCLDIEEEISLNTDGSGSYRMSVDMGEMMSMLQGFMGDADGQGGDIFDTMDSTLQVQVQNLRAIDGLSNVGHQAENYAFTISYDFANVEALNQASNQGDGLSGMEALGLPGGESPSGNNGPAYSWTSKSFSRTNLPIEDVFNEMEEDEETAAALGMAKMMMADATYKIVYSFPGKVKKYSNENATLSVDKKTLTLDMSMLDILEGKSEMGNEVKFKRR